jgi:hypothetical protein
VKWKSVGTSCQEAPNWPRVAVPGRPGLWTRFLPPAPGDMTGGVLAVVDHLQRELAGQGTGFASGAQLQQWAVVSPARVAGSEPRASWSCTRPSRTCSGWTGSAGCRDSWRELPPWRRFLWADQEWALGELGRRGSRLSRLWQVLDEVDLYDSPEGALHPSQLLASGEVGAPSDCLGRHERVAQFTLRGALKECLYGALMAGDPVVATIGQSSLASLPKSLWDQVDREVAEMILRGGPGQMSAGWDGLICIAGWLTGASDGWPCGIMGRHSGWPFGSTCSRCTPCWWDHWSRPSA